MALVTKHAIVAVAVLTVVGGVGMATMGTIGGSMDAAPTDALVGEEEPLSVATADETTGVGASTTAVVEATLRNDADRERVRTVSLELRGEGDDAVRATREREVTVPADGSADISFEIPADEVGPGTWDYTVVVDTQSADGPSTAAEGTVTFDPATYALDGRAVGSADGAVADNAERDRPSVLPGDEVDVIATVENGGDFDGEPAVRLLFDRNRDGEFSSEEAVTTKYPAVSAGTEAELRFNVSTVGLEPGTYRYRIVAEGESIEGSFDVLAPARFTVENTSEQAGSSGGANVSANVTGNATDDANATVDTNATASVNESSDAPTNATESALAADPADVLHGENATLSVRVRNHGEVAGERTVALVAPDGTLTAARRVSLAGGENDTLSFVVDTGDLDRGNYTYTAVVSNASVNVSSTAEIASTTAGNSSTATGNESVAGDRNASVAALLNESEDEAELQLRVRDAQFEVISYSLQGPDRMTLDDELTAAPGYATSATPTALERFDSWSISTATTSRKGTT
ncbi:CARDB domain-containing protein [Halobaculum halobium]|uniref:CARDB domain-containing protein n=1 Tax=Halobaculum halobium TaxID=3032281 RepID=UPI003615A171